MDAESIKKSHKSHPYNQKIADVLYKADYIESWGTGVPRMVDICKAAGLPEPYYEITDGFVTLVFKKIERDLAFLKNAEFIVREGHTKNACWKVIG